MAGARSTRTSADELWTPGQAAEYLNAGGVDLGYTARRVSLMIDRAELTGYQEAGQRWRRVLASSVRELRRQRLAALGVVDEGGQTD